MTRAAILVPRRADGGPRDELWRLCRRRWQAQHPWPIYEGIHDVGPFNRAAAINRAAELADQDGPWEIALVIDSDVFLAPDQVRRAMEIAEDTGRVTWAHRRWRGLTADGTKRILAGDTELLGGRTFEEWDGGAQARVDAISDALYGGGPTTAGQDARALADALLTVRPDMLDSAVERTTPISWSCAIAIRRDAWDQLGGFDERFRGWGWEDMAFQSAACSLVGHERIEGDVFHLWHPRSPGAGKAGQAGAAPSDDAIRNAQLGRRYMVAARRDYGIHDRGAPSDAAELERDVANLVRDDAAIAAQARRAGRPTMTGWPELGELLEGAAAARAAGEAWAGARPRSAHDRSVTIAVHTDGRREYIAESIESLEASVHGQIERRVIYDDSGDPAYKAWLEQRFGGLGYYVVGPAGRLGYTGSMQALWRYLARRATTSYVLLAEDDFVYERPVELDDLAAILEAGPHLRQVALLRRPYYQAELEAGSIIAQDPGAYEQRRDGERAWLEHRLYFTANPSLFRRELTAAEPWPSGASSERRYTDQLNRDPRSRFAYLGTGEAWIRHIGARRAGAGY
jgi:hypothetical protein